MLSYTAASDIGLVRSINEDSIFCAPNEFFVVADGMGGHVAGEVASHIFTDTMKGLWSYLHIKSSKTDFLREMMQAGNRAILDSLIAHPERKGMGTTASMLYIGEEKAYWAHVGDSRLYHLQQGSLRQVTKDHTYVNDLLAKGSITPLEAMNHSRRNMLMRAVGVHEDLEVDAGEFSLIPGDILLLCSDGLTNMVTEEAIQTVLEANNCSDKAAALITCAKAAGGTDNISVIVVEYHGL